MASNPLLKFKTEILTVVIYPKIHEILLYEKGNISYNLLWKKFREANDCTVSLREFKEWCEELGLYQEQVIKWHVPKEENEVDYVVHPDPNIRDAHINGLEVFPKNNTPISNDEAFNRMMDNEPVDPDINFDND